MSIFLEFNLSSFLSLLTLKMVAFLANLFGLPWQKVGENLHPSEMIKSHSSVIFFEYNCPLIPHKPKLNLFEIEKRSLENLDVK